MKNRFFRAAIFTHDTPAQGVQLYVFCYFAPTITLQLPFLLFLSLFTPVSTSTHTLHTCLTHRSCLLKFTTCTHVIRCKHTKEGADKKQQCTFVGCFQKKHITFVRMSPPYAIIWKNKHIINSRKTVKQRKKYSSLY